jgi:hypothetical protein
MQNLGKVCIWGSPFGMCRTDAQNGVDIIFKKQDKSATKTAINIILMQKMSRN